MLTPVISHSSFSQLYKLFKVDGMGLGRIYNMLKMLTSVKLIGVFDNTPGDVKFSMSRDEKSILAA